MTLILISGILLSVSAADPSQAEPRLRTAQSEFNRGDYQGALRTLDAAAASTSDDGTLSRIHLLRGQCFAARRDFASAEYAFRQALEHDPEATLDPAKVDPAVVELIEGLRAQMHGELRVNADHTPSDATLDGKPLGPIPIRKSVAIGRHTVEVKTTDGRLVAREQVLVRANRLNEVTVKLTEVGHERTGPELKPATASAQAGHETDQSPRPFADLRGVFAPLASNDVAAFEIGGGVESGPLHASLHAGVYPNFGLTLRGGLSVPITDVILLSISIEAPFIFRGTTAAGIGGAGGAEYLFNRWFGVFGEVGVRHYFSGYADETNRLVLQGGARFHIP